MIRFVLVLLRLSFSFNNLRWVVCWGFCLFVSQVHFSFVCFASRVIPGVLSWVLTLELSNIMFL